MLVDPPNPVATPLREPRLKRMLELRSIYPPMGLAYIASVLRNNGVETGIIDARSLGLSHEEVASVIEKECPDLVGITVATPQYGSALRLSKLIKGASPSTRIMLGGPHIHFEHRSAIRNERVDYCVRGEGEKTPLIERRLGLFFLLNPPQQ